MITVSEVRTLVSEHDLRNMIMKRANNDLRSARVDAVVFYRSHHASIANWFLSGVVGTGEAAEKVHVIARELALTYDIEW